MLTWLGWDHHYAGEPGPAMRYLQQAVDLLSAGPPRLELVEALRGLGWQFGERRDLPRAQEAFDEAARVAEQLGDADAVADTWSVFGNLLSIAGTQAGRETITRRSADAYERLGRTADAAANLRKLAYLLRHRAADAEAEEVLQRAVHLALDSGSEITFAYVSLELSEVALDRGDPGGARTHAEAASERLRRLPEFDHEDAWAYMSVQSQLSEIGYREGRPAHARAALDEAVSAGITAARQSQGVRVMTSLTTPVSLAEEHGDVHGATRSLGRIVASLQEHDHGRAAGRWLQGWTARLGRRSDEAQELFAEARDEARAMGDRSFQSLMMFEGARVARQRGDSPAARSELGERLALVEDLGFKVSIARTHLELARVARLEGRQADLEAHDRELWTRWRDLDGLPLCEVVEHLAQSLSTEGRDEAALRLFASASSWRERTARPLPAVDASDVAAAVASVRDRVDNATFARGWSDGSGTELRAVLERDSP